MNWRFKWMVVTLTFLALGIATGLLLYLLPSKKYYIESSVLLDKSGSESLLKIGSLGSDGFRRTTVYNRLATLKSNGTLARAVVHAQRDPVEFAKAETVLKARYCGPDPERTGIAGCMIRYLKNEVEATVDRNADVITIRLSTATPDAGAYLMKALLSAWV